MLRRLFAQNTFYDASNCHLIFYTLLENILNPATPLALRVSGHLMLGIVRIYSRKVRYLIADCADAMWKIKLVR